MCSFIAAPAIAQVYPNPGAPTPPPTTTPPATTAPPATTSPPATTAPPATGESSADQRFIREAAQANLAAIRLGDVAVRNGSTAEIRKLGQTIMEDHRKLNQRILPIATRLHVTMPTEETPEQRATYNRLSVMTGVAFDDAWLDDLKTAHQQIVSLFQDAAQNTVDPQLKTFAQSSVPSLKAHQQMVNRPSKKM
jgi:putative membrane protein